MAEITKMYWLHALTPLHVGEGFGICAIDLPIVRERTTKWPLVPGSAVKGVIADKYDASGDNARTETDKADEAARIRARRRKAAFGTAGEDMANSGALVFTDARVAAIPVHSDFGTFAWISSKPVLMRLQRDLRAANGDAGLSADIEVAERTLHVPEGVTSELKGPDGRAYLGDIDLAVKSCQKTAAWAKRLAEQVFEDEVWRTEFVKRFAVVPRGTFDFFAQNGMEVAARIRIEAQTKTVSRGGLWYEEYLPAETVLAGIVWCDRVFTKDGIKPDDLVKEFCTAPLMLQVGGKATIGKGRARCVFGGANA